VGKRGKRAKRARGQEGNWREGERERGQEGERARGHESKKAYQSGEWWCVTARKKAAREQRDVWYQEGLTDRAVHLNLDHR
jgi:hypothetical protein